MYYDRFFRVLGYLALLVLPIFAYLGMVRKHGPKYAAIVTLISSAMLTIAFVITDSWSHEVIHVCQFGQCGPGNGPTTGQAIIEGIFFLVPVVTFFVNGVEEIVHRFFRNRYHNGANPVKTDNEDHF